MISQTISDVVTRQVALARDMEVTGGHGIAILKKSCRQGDFGNWDSCETLRRMGLWRDEPSTNWCRSSSIHSITCLNLVVVEYAIHLSNQLAKANNLSPSNIVCVASQKLVQAGWRGTQHNTNMERYARKNGFGYKNIQLT